MGLNSLVIFQGFFAALLFMLLVVIWFNLGNLTYSIKSRRLVVILLFLLVPILIRAFSFLNIFAAERLSLIILAEFLVFLLFIASAFFLHDKLKKGRKNELEILVSTKTQIKDDINRQLVLPEIIKLNNLKKAIASEIGIVENLKKEHAALQDKLGSINIDVRSSLKDLKSKELEFDKKSRELADRMRNVESAEKGTNSMKSKLELDKKNISELAVKLKGKERMLLDKEDALKEMKEDINSISKSMEKEKEIVEAKLNSMVALRNSIKEERSKLFNEASELRKTKQNIDYSLRKLNDEKAAFANVKTYVLKQKEDFGIRFDAFRKKEFDLKSLERENARKEISLNKLQEDLKKRAERLAKDSLGLKALQKQLDDQQDLLDEQRHDVEDQLKYLEKEHARLSSKRDMLDKLHEEQKKKEQELKARMDKIDIEEENLVDTKEMLEKNKIMLQKQLEFGQSMQKKEGGDHLAK